MTTLIVSSPFKDYFLDEHFNLQYYADESYNKIALYFD